MKTLLLALFLRGCLTTFAQSIPQASTGIHFETTTWQAVLTKARQHQKLIFIDLYTTWCAPCRQLAQEAFPQPRVGDIFNKHFINYKLDAEKGEGVYLSRKYKITVYPTLLFVQSNGEIVYRQIGYESPEWLIGEAQKVVQASDQFKAITAANPDLPDPLKDPVYRKEYLKLLARLRQPAGDLLDLYLSQLPADQIRSPENLSIMAGTVATTRSKAFDILVDELPAIKDSPVGQEALTTLPNAVALDFSRLVETNDEKGLDDLIQANKRLMQQAGRLSPERVEQENLLQRIDFYRQTRRYELYHRLTQFYVQTQLLSQSPDSLRKQDQRAYQEFAKRIVMSDSLRRTPRFIRMDNDMKQRASMAVADKLNEMAWAYYESMSKQAYLKEALTWSQSAVALYAAPTYMDTHAHLLYKLNRKKEAIEQEQMALQKALEQEKDVAEIRTTLENMRKGLL